MTKTTKIPNCISEKAFGALNFRVEKITDKSKNGMVTEIKKIRDEDFNKYECVVLYLLSHGNDYEEDEDHDDEDDESKEKNGIYMYGIDGKTVDINWIVDTVQDNETLRGKPKLIFSDMCRGGKDMKAVPVPSGSIKGADVDEGKMRGRAKKADTLLFHATSNGYVAWVTPNSANGSHFTYALCRAMEGLFGQNEWSQNESKRKSLFHLGDVVTKVNEHLAVYANPNQEICVQMSEVWSSLGENVYFYKPVSSY